MCPFATVRDDDFVFDNLDPDSPLSVSTNGSQFEKQKLQSIILEQPFIFDDLRWRVSLGQRPITIDRLKQLNPSVENALGSLLDSGELVHVFKCLGLLLETGFKPSMLLKQKTQNQPAQSLFVQFFQSLLLKDSSHCEDWFEHESTIPTELPQFQAKLCTKMKKKNNFVVLVDLFLPNEQYDWLFLLLLDLLTYVKETYVSSVQSTKMRGKFEFIFGLLGLDIFFPNAYSFASIIRVLLDNLDCPTNVSVYKQSKIEILTEIVNILISFAIHQSWSLLVDFAEETSVLLRTAPIDAVFNFCNVISFDLLAIMRKLFEKRFMVRVSSGVRNSQTGWFSLPVLAHKYLLAEVAETPGKRAGSSSESALLLLLKKLLLENFLEMRKIGNTIYLDELELDIVSSSPYLTCGIDG